MVDRGRVVTSGKLRNCTVDQTQKAGTEHHVTPRETRPRRRPRATTPCAATSTCRPTWSWACSARPTRICARWSDLLTADIHVRGNASPCPVSPPTWPSPSVSVTELIAVVASGQRLTPDAVRHSVVDAHRSGQRVTRRGADAGHPVAARQDHPAQDAQPEALRRRDRRAHHRVRHRAGRHRQDLPRDGEGGRGAADQAGRAHHPRPARRWRPASASASCPAR